MGILVFVVAAAFIALMVWVVRWAKHQEARKALQEKPNAALRERRARELGWRYDGSHHGDIRYRFFGSSKGVTWELKYDSDASSSTSDPKVIWICSSLAAQQTEFVISNGKYFEVMQTPIAQKIAAGAARLARAVAKGALDDTLEFLQQANVQTVGSAAFRTQLKAISRSPVVFGHFLDAEMEHLLLSWPQAVEAKFDPFAAVTVTQDTTGLRIECRYDSTDLPLFEHLVKIGEGLIDRMH
jgi:hypothetical protein